MLHIPQFNLLNEECNYSVFVINNYFHISFNCSALFGARGFLLPSYNSPAREKSGSEVTELGIADK